MKPTYLAGLAVVVALVAVLAFYFGQQIAEERDGPAEQLGESLDQAAEELEEGAREAQEAQ